MGVARIDNIRREGFGVTENLESQKPEKPAPQTKAAKTDVHFLYTEAGRVKLAELYPQASRKEVQAVFPGLTWRQIRDAAAHWEIRRDKAANARQITNDLWLEYLAQSRSLREIMKKFHISEEEAKGKLAKPIASWQLYQHRNPSSGEDMFIYLHGVREAKTQPRAWKYVHEQTGKPGAVIVMPDDIGWSPRADEETRVGKEKIRLVPLSDAWLLHSLHDAASFGARLSWIAEAPHVFAVLNGNIVYPFSEKQKPANFVYEQLRRKLAPIAHKILWASQGAFELKYEMTHDGFDPLERFCLAMDIPYFKSPSMNILLWRGNQFSFYCIPGRSVAQQKGSKLNAVIRPLQFIDWTHYVVMSHVRDNVWKKVMRAVRNRKAITLELRKQFVVTSPSFIRYDGSRDSQWAYTPPSRGRMELVVYESGDYHIYLAPLRELKPAQPFPEDDPEGQEVI
jgi:hypothetical protein